MINAQYILDNSDLLIKSDCKIVDDCLYEKVKFDNDLFIKSDFSSDTYYLNNDDHIYRVFLDIDDYDYVTDAKLIERLNEVFA